jgi:hypothetical protein
MTLLLIQAFGLDLSSLLDAGGAVNVSVATGFDCVHYWV